MSSFRLLISWRQKVISSNVCRAAGVFLYFEALEDFVYINGAFVAKIYISVRLDFLPRPLKCAKFDTNRPLTWHTNLSEIILSKNPSNWKW